MRHPYSPLREGDIVVPIEAALCVLMTVHSGRATTVLVSSDTTCTRHAHTDHAPTNTARQHATTREKAHRERGKRSGAGDCVCVCVCVKEERDCMVDASATVMRCDASSGL